MPTYMFICDTCEQRETINAGIEEKIVTPFCRICEEMMRRDYGFMSIRFTGKGFYSTDK